MGVAVLVHELQTCAVLKVAPLCNSYSSKVALCPSFGTLFKYNFVTHYCGTL